MTKPFRQLSVLELCGSFAGAYAGKIFSDYGATVVRLEPPEGDPVRHQQPSAFEYLNTGKRSHVLDAARDLDRLRGFAEWADVVIESSAPDPLTPQTRELGNPSLVRVEISPFGSTGPLARYRSNEFTDDAHGGQVFLNGEPSREPIGRPGQQPLYGAGLHAFIGALSALRVSEATGVGQTVEVSHLEGLAAMHQHTISMYTHSGHILEREGNRQPGIFHPAGVYACKDGYVLLCLASHTMRDRFLVALGVPELLLDPRFVDDVSVALHKQEFDDAILPHLMSRTVNEIVELSQAAASPVGPVLAPSEIPGDVHLLARDFWRSLDGRRYPRGPFQITGMESEIRPAPELGELGELPLASPKPKATRGIDELAQGPLSGLRVLDLTRVWAGPFAGRLLADLGADVVLIESPLGRGPAVVSSEQAKATHFFPDDDPGERPWNRLGVMNKLWRNRRGITLDLREPRAKEVFEELVRWADVVIENFSPRVMPKLGLGFEQLRELNPSIVYTAISGYGTTGPSKDWVALGPVIEAGSGLTHGLGYSDSGPYRAGVAWTDPLTGLHAIAATLIALHERDADPERSGRMVESPMVEAMVSVVGELLIEAQKTGKDPARQGNRHTLRAPQGVYPCSGEERWLALSITSDDEWLALCSAAALPREWSGFTLEKRLALHDEIDSRLSSWTRTQERDSLVQSLQSLGVIAAPLSDARDLVENEQLAARRFWADLVHPDAGRHLEPGCAIRLSRTPVTYRRAAPGLGQHNREVLRECAGLDDAEIDALEAAEILVDKPPS